MRALLFLILLLSAFFGGINYLYHDALQQKLALPEALDVHIQRGEGIVSIANQFKEKQWLKNHWAMIVYAYRHNLVRKIQAGTYRITPDMTVEALLHDLTAGKVVVHQFRLVEGKRFRDVQQQLQRESALTQTEWQEADLAARWGLPNASLEGWLLPETYHFDAGARDVDLMRRMHEDLKDYLHHAWNRRAPNLPLETPYEALILASLIEKETAKDSERPEIAGVFIRRLQKKMRLQTDPSVIYGLDLQGANLSRKHLQQDHPHNTYTRAGLPPTPIAMVSRASIDAALHPAAGEALFFVADGQGGHTFSRTYEEHLRAVERLRGLKK